MIKAAEKLVPIFVDCDWGKKNKDLSDKYGVRGYPTVIFTDPEGTQISKLAGRDPAAVLQQINDIVEKFPGVATVDSWDVAAEQAKEASKPVLCLFVTAKADSKALEDSLADASLKELLEKFVILRVEIKKDSADAKKFSVATSSQPVLFVVDPALEKPESKPLKKLTGKKSPKELKKELEEALKKFETPK